jgi:tRNA(His) 5'-end guanylyltransferase
VETPFWEIQEETATPQIQEEKWRTSVSVHQSEVLHQKQCVNISKETQL